MRKKEKKVVLYARINLVTKLTLEKLAEEYGYGKKLGEFIDTFTQSLLLQTASESGALAKKSK
jgi:hypothetical protein